MAKYLILGLLLVFNLAPAMAVTTENSCKAVGGETIGDQCYCTKQSRFIDPSSDPGTKCFNSSESSNATRSSNSSDKIMPWVRSFVATTDQLNKTSSCNCSNPPPSTDCPNFVYSIKKSQEQSSFFNFIEKPSSQCPLNPDKISVAEYELQLAADPQISLGIPPPHVFSAQRCLALDTPQKNKIAASSYYWLANRFNDGELNVIEQVSSINRLLEESSLSGISCESKLNPHLDLWCKQLKKCASSQSIDQFYQEAESIVKMKEELIKESGSRLACITPSKVEGVLSKSPPCRVLVALNSLYPWLEGEYFNSAYNKNKDVKAALKVQLRHNRDKLINENLTVIRKNRDCFLGSSPKACGSLEEALDGLPNIDITQDLNLSDEKKIQRSTIANYFGYLECVSSKHQAIEKTNEILTDSAINAGLTIATAGLGSLATSSRLVALTKGAENTAKALENLIWGMDGTYLGSGTYLAVSHCRSFLDQLTGLDLTKKTSSPSCSSSNVDQITTINDYKACVLTGLTDIAPNLLPFLPAIAKLFGTRVKVTEEERLTTHAVETKRGLIRKGAKLELGKDKELEQILFEYHDYFRVPPDNETLELISKIEKRGISKQRIKDVLQKAEQQCAP